MKEHTQIITSLHAGADHPSCGKPARTGLRGGVSYPPAGKTWQWCYKGDWYKCTRTDDLEESCVRDTSYIPPEGVTCSL